ncbi:MAG: hypothetical protein ACJ79D_23345 [Myxococcales bacterium]
MVFGIALLAALAQPSPLSFRLETAYLQPTSDDEVRGVGAGLGAGYRVTDQISVVGAASRGTVWTRNGQPAGAPRVSRPVSLFAAGAQAVLDATPIAPFLEATLAQLTPGDIAGYSVAARIALGADWAFVRSWAVGLAVRSLFPLDAPGGGFNSVGGVEIAARLIWTPVF